MHKSPRRRPEFESLESVMLLSTLLPTVRHAGPVSFSGTLQATVDQFSKSSTGTITRSTGPGVTNLNSLVGGSALGRTNNTVAFAPPISRPVRGSSTVPTPLGITAATDKVATPIRSAGPALLPMVGRISRPSTTIKFS